MEPLDLPIEPYANDPEYFGVSLINLAEVLVPVLDAAQARSVLEVGAYAGDLTGLLLEWAARSGAKVVAIDPSPQPELEQLDEQTDALELIREPSLEALAHVPLPDAVVIDGDHNHYTISEELRTIAERAGGAPLPLLLFHDVAWPHGRRDDYFSPDAVPEEHRQPVTPRGCVFPGEPEAGSEGLWYPCPAAREGGPANGVLTAVEDFVAAREGLALAVVPAFFGLAAVWPLAAPWAPYVAELLERWDDNPLLERLEANRVFHLAACQTERRRTEVAEERDARRNALLEGLLRSRSFALAESISRLWQRGEPVLSRAEIRKLVGRD